MAATFARYRRNARSGTSEPAESGCVQAYAFGCMRDFNGTILILTQIGAFASVWEYSGTLTIPVRMQSGWFASVWEYSGVPTISIPTQRAAKGHGRHSFLGLRNAP